VRLSLAEALVLADSASEAAAVRAMSKHHLGGGWKMDSAEEWALLQRLALRKLRLGVSSTLFQSTSDFD